MKRTILTALAAASVLLLAFGAIAEANKTGFSIVDVLADVTAGTVSASKAVVVDANKRVDTLDITTLEIGNVAVTATAAEINKAADVSSWTQAITEAGAITASGTIHHVTIAGGGGGYAVTLAAPGTAGIVLCVEYLTGSTDAVTLAMTNIDGGSAATSISMNAAGEGVCFMSGALKWHVTSEFGGVTLS